MRFSLVFFLSVVLLFTGCNRHKPTHAQASFYYWKTVFELSAEDSAMLQANNVERLYVRFFDVEESYWYEAGATPRATIKFEQHLPKDIEVVPVVFIRNRALLEIDSAKIPALAEKICKRVSKMMLFNGIAHISELQLDCDWSEDSKDKYFYLLQEIRKQKAADKLSATIRLYQYKYATASGVPPVDRGVLMFYNMANFNEPAEQNLVMDFEEGKKYMSHKKYPLPLDFALPAFAQTIVFDRFSNKLEILKPEYLDSLQAKGLIYLEDTIEGIYVPGDTLTMYNKRFTYGTRLKKEEAGLEQLQQAAKLLSEFTNSDTTQVIFFHIDKTANARYTPQDIKALVDRF
jgi:hypothetical protein